MDRGGIDWEIDEETDDGRIDGELVRGIDGEIIRESKQ